METDLNRLGLELVRHFDDLQRYSSGISDDAAELYRESEEEIYKLLEQIFAVLGKGKIADDYRSSQKLAELQKRISEIRYNTSNAVVELLRKESRDVISAEGAFLVLLASAMMTGVRQLTKSDPEQIWRYGKYHGLTQKQIMEKVTQGDISRIYESISNGLDNGNSLDEIRSELRKRMLATRRYVKSEADTVINGISNDVALAMAAKNKTRLLYSAVLDSHVCEDCSSLHGTIFDYDSPDIPALPIHIFCRCHLIPIADDGADEIASVSFKQYFESLNEKEKIKRIGSAKYAQYQSGELPVEEYMEPFGGARMTLAQMMKRDLEALS